MDIRKKKIIEELAPWVQPKDDFWKEQGITYGAMNHYCHRKGIPLWRENMKQERADFENEYQGFLEDVIAEKKRRLQEWLNGNNQ